MSLTETAVHVSLVSTTYRAAKAVNDATATLLAPQTVSVISLAASASVSLGSQVNTVSAVRSTSLDSVRRVANLVTVTQKAQSLLSARMTGIVSVAQASWERAATCVRRTTSTTAPHQAASSVPTVTAWSETR